MCRPLLSITAWHLLLHIFCIHQRIFSHSILKLVHSYSTSLGFFSLAPSFRNFQTFSIVFMSELWAGHFITVTSSSDRNILTDFTVRHGALSCIYTARGLNVVLKLVTCFFNISLYKIALIWPCSLMRSPVPKTEIMPNTITLPFPNSMLLLVHWGEYLSLGLHRTDPHPSQPNRLNNDSLLKGTQSHCYSVHMTCWVANFSRLILFFLEMYGFVEATGLFKFISLSLREIVCLDILLPTLALFYFIFLEIAVAVTNRSFFYSLPILLTSIAVVFLGRPGDFLALHDPFPQVFLKYYEWHF